MNEWLALEQRYLGWGEEERMATLFDKIWDAHVVAQRPDGRDLLYIDRHVVHELHGPHALKHIEDKNRSVRRPDLTVAVQDHTVPTQPGRAKSSQHIEAMRSGAQRHGIKLLDVGDAQQGIVHVVSPELGIALPGLTLACPDSHASTVGALGTLGFGCGTTELEHIFATQVMALHKPKQMRILFEGRLGPGINAKDVALHLIRTVGVDAGGGYAVEYAGSGHRGDERRGAPDAVQPDHRMGRAHLPDRAGRKDDRLVRGPTGAPTGELWDAALAWWRTLFTDADARFDREVRIDCTSIEPQITWGTDPAQVIGVSELIPGPDDGDEAQRDKTQRALDYMDLSPRPTPARRAGRPRFHRLLRQQPHVRPAPRRRTGAGRKVAPGVTAIVVPGSSTVKRLAEQEGLDRIFTQAGFEWRDSGCSMCAGANGESGSRASAASPPPTAISRIGRDAASVPISPARPWRSRRPSPERSPTCANCERLGGAMEPFNTVTGIAAPLLQDDINTDQIIPSLYLRQLDADLAEGLFAYMRRKPDGSSNTDFVLEKPQYRSSAILVVGENFGCGSSREHAAWAMAAFGIRCVIGRSHAEYFRENCLKNGILAVSLESEDMDLFIAAVTEADGSSAFTVDLKAQQILGSKPEQEWTFAIAPFERVALLEGLDEIGLTMKHASAIGEWEARTAGARPYLQNFKLS